MKRVIGLLLVVLVMCWAVVPAEIGRSAEGFSALPSALTYRFVEAGSDVKQVEVRNNSADFRTYVATAEQYRVFTDQEIAAGKKYADVGWVGIQPGVMSLPSGGKGYLNVTVTVSSAVGDGVYQTYVKVTDGVGEEYVTTNVLVGEEVGVHEYGISPGYYELLAKGKGERRSKELTVTVVNSGTADAEYLVYSRVPDSPGDIDPGYRVGDVAWIRILDPEMELAAGTQGEAKFRVVIPGEVEEGKYKVWIGVKDVDQVGTVQVEYACKLLMTVESSRGFPWWAGVLIGVGVVGAIVGIVVIGKRRRSSVGKGNI